MSLNGFGTTQESLGELLDGWKDGAFKVQFSSVCGVDVDSNSVQGGLDGLLGAGVKHLASDRGSVRAPGDENQLGGRAAIVGSELQIYQSVAAVIIRHILAEVFVSGIALSVFVDLNSLLVNDLVDVVTVLESRRLDLEAFKGSGNVVCANYTCGLRKAKKINISSNCPK